MSQERSNYIRCCTCPACEEEGVRLTEIRHGGGGMMSEAKNDRCIVALEAGLTVMRRLLWLHHGHVGLYGDDGEMQCGTCLIDFKRSTPTEIEAAFFRRWVDVLDAAQEKRDG